MEDIVKQVIVGGITIAAMGSGLVATGGGITSLDGQMMTLAQYSNLKETLTNKYLLKQNFTMNEYVIFTKLLDKEAKQNKFKNIKNVTEGTLLPRIVDKVIQKE